MITNFRTRPLVEPQAPGPQDFVQAHASASRPPGTAHGELLNVKQKNETVQLRACRLLGDVLGQTTAQIFEEINLPEDAPETDRNWERWGLQGLIFETLVPALVNGSSDNATRAELRRARQEGDVTSAYFYTDGADWRDGTGEWG